MTLTVRLFLNTFPVPRTFCGGIEKPAGDPERLRNASAPGKPPAGEGSMLMVLVGVVAAMIVQWLF